MIGPDFAGDLSSWTAPTPATTHRPVTFSALSEPSAAPAWEDDPSLYLVDRRDLRITACRQRFMAKRAHAHSSLVDASHMSLISQPGAVERIILAALHATG